MALFYSEWCDKYRLDYFDPENRAAWNRYCEAERNKPLPKITADVTTRITRTWHQDRAEELARRARNHVYRILWPQHPIPIVRSLSCLR